MVKSEVAYRRLVKDFRSGKYDKMTNAKISTILIDKIEQLDQRLTILENEYKARERFARDMAWF